MLRGLCLGVMDVAWFGVGLENASCVIKTMWFNIRRGEVIGSSCTRRRVTVSRPFFSGGGRNQPPKDLRI